MVVEPICFFGRQSHEKLHHLRTERNLNRRLKPSRAFACLDFLPNSLKREMRACEDFAGQPLAFANQPKQQMLGPD